jgi:cytochrome c-type biogenesis protein CcmH/NrfF
MRKRGTTRRELAGALIAAVLAPRRSFGQSRQDAQDNPTAGLMDPQWAGRPRNPITEYETDPFIVDIEKQLKCSCGCSLSVYVCRTTDFNCEYSPALHAEVVAMAKQQMTAQEIIDAYVAKHGEEALMAPRPEGFNLAGYFVPGVLITAVAGTLAWILVRRTRAMAAAGSAPIVPDQDLVQEDDAKIKAALEDLGI